MSHSGNSRNLISSVDYVVERAKESHANDSLPGYSLNCDKARSRLYETLTSRWYSTGSIKSVLSLSIVVKSKPMS